ncbi:hypothetical protein U1Q18_027711 [Sarracenia purpurea var. burkii]
MTSGFCCGLIKRVTDAKFVARVRASIARVVAVEGARATEETRPTRETQAPTAEGVQALTIEEARPAGATQAPAAKGVQAPTVEEAQPTGGDSGTNGLGDTACRGDSGTAQYLRGWGARD